MEPVCSHASREVSQNYEDETGNSKQRHSGPKIKRNVESWASAQIESGRELDCRQEFAQVARLTPIAVQDSALENIPVGSIS